VALNGLSPVNLERFGGLRLDLDPEEVGNGAVDSLNVMYDRSGSRVGSRWGYSSLFINAGDSYAQSTFAPYTSSSAVNYLVLCNTSGGTRTYDLYTAAGTYVLSAAGTAAAYRFSSAPFGTPTLSRLYIADGGTQMYRVEGASITAIHSATTYASTRHVCSTSDGRLAYAAPASFPNRVYFSDPGAPETIGVNNYVDLAPGDNEQITGMVLFREQLFVFKETKFFVFYGTSADATGNPVFNYRTVSAGNVGARPGTAQAVCVGSDGVYFSNSRAVYRTSGGEAVRISEPIDPFLNGETLPLFAQDTFEGDVSRLRWIDGRLFVLLSVGVIPVGAFVWDSQSGTWAFWGTLLADVAPPFRSASLAEKVLGLLSDVGRVVTFTQGVTTDAGAAIASRLRSGLMDFGSPGQEKVIRQTQITGQGTVTFGWSRDFGASPALGTVTLGTAPAVARAFARTAYQGETLSYTLQGTGAWQVNRIVPMIRSVRGAGERTT
jgi:hypothetical protein